MSVKLKIRVARQPDPDALLSAREIRPSKRLLRTIFGTSKPRHKMAILLPGSEADTVEVRVSDIADDDLMALAEAVGVTGNGGDRQ